MEYYILLGSNILYVDYELVLYYTVLSSYTAIAYAILYEVSYYVLEQNAAETYCTDVKYSTNKSIVTFLWRGHCGNVYSSKTSPTL